MTNADPLPTTVLSRKAVVYVRQCFASPPAIRTADSLKAGNADRGISTD
jgi:hypothetical protein